LVGIYEVLSSKVGLVYTGLIVLALAAFSVGAALLLLRKEKSEVPSKQVRDSLEN
jgi:hypothetical protein